MSDRIVAQAPRHSKTAKAMPRRAISEDIVVRKSSIVGTIRYDSESDLTMVEAAFVQISRDLAEHDEVTDQHYEFITGMHQKYEINVTLSALPL